jgi:hypothetical protein
MSFDQSPKWSKGKDIFKEQLPIRAYFFKWINVVSKSGSTVHFIIAS